MRKFVAITVGAMLLTTASAYATSETSAASHNQVNPSANSTPIQNDQIMLYANPDTQKLLQKLPANAPLIPIYRKGEWIKMGDRATGEVGWVNQNQWQQARENFYRPEIQTFFVNVEHNSQGKPTISIIGFKNGKKMSEEQAREMYGKIRRQQEQELQSMQRLNHQMDEIASRDTLRADTIPMLEPLVIYPQIPALSDNNQVNNVKTAKVTTNNK